MIWDLLDVHLPIVCALNGHAIGLGASIALLCDAVFMAESATIADPHVRVGIVGRRRRHGGVAARRRSDASQALLAHRRRRAGRGSGSVWVSSPRSSPTTRLDDRAMAFAQRLAAGAPLAVQDTKQAVNQIDASPADDRRSISRPRSR